MFVLTSVPCKQHVKSVNDPEEHDELADQINYSSQSTTAWDEDETTMLKLGLESEEEASSFHPAFRQGKILNFENIRDKITQRVETFT